MSLVRQHGSGSEALLPIEQTFLAVFPTTFTTARTYVKTAIHELTSHQAKSQERQPTIHHALANLQAVEQMLSDLMLACPLVLSPAELEAIESAKANAIEKARRDSDLMQSLIRQSQAERCK